LQRNQSVFEMVEDILARQAKSLADKTGQPLERALDLVTDAGQQLRELANGEYCNEKARDWQASMLWDRAEELLMHLIASDTISRFAAERPNSWLEGYMKWLEGKEERAGYYSLLEEELASLRG
jgi:hypothetical protein